MLRTCRIVLPDVINRYFEADGRQDNDAIVELFTHDPVVVDEGKTRRGLDDIRAWREGPASQCQYATEVFDAHSTSEHAYVVTGLITGSFPVASPT
jgi:hypothetical protein